MRLIEAIVKKNEGVLRVFLTPFAMLSCVTLDLNGPARASRGGKKGSQETRAIRERMSRFRWVNVARGRGTDDRTKNKRTRGCDEGYRVQKQGAVEIGVGNGAWIESLYGNEKLRRKSVECNEKPLSLRGNNDPIWHWISH